jgi:hypothetical protein
MSKEIIGYRFRQTLDVDYWEPIYPLQRGMIATAAIMSCQDCHRTISSSGGPGYNCVCPECYNKFKLVNFTAGNDPL